jgi:hypothetical protein
MTNDQMTNEMRALLALITNEWRPLPLNEIASITGCAPVQGGNVLRHRLGLWTPPGGTDTELGRTYIHDRFGMRLVRCYRSTNEGTRYWWRRFPAETSDADILADALTLTSHAHLFGSRVPKPRKQAEPSLFAPVPTAQAIATTPVPPPAAPADDLAVAIARNRAEGERLEAVRRARIDTLQAEIDRLASA